MTDAINPTHYTRGSVECIDAIEAAIVDKRGIEAACTANIIKYLWRYEAKNGIEDVKKARWYLERLLAHLGNVQEAQFGQQNTIDCRTKEERAADIGRQLADGVRRAASGSVCNDPRTVVGLDVSFPTEKHMSFAPEQCECHRCIEEKGLKVGPLPLSSVKMILCPTCGNKRCPKANDHRNECSGSNEPGQPGSAYK